GGLKALRNASVGLALVLTVALVAAGPWFYQTGLWGMTAFLVVLCAWVALIFSTERQQPSMI
ncbi:sodium:solute symporter family protein, partial [Desulfovibrio sp. 1214_IL3152]